MKRWLDPTGLAQLAARTTEQGARTCDAPAITLPPPNTPSSAPPWLECPLRIGTPAIHAADRFRPAATKQRKVLQELYLRDRVSHATMPFVRASIHAPRFPSAPHRRLLRRALGADDACRASRPEFPAGGADVRGAARVAGKSALRGVALELHPALPAR